MDLKFFTQNNILESSKLFFRSILDISISPSRKSEINISEFLKEQLTDKSILEKVDDARIVGIINTLSIEHIKNNIDTELLLKQPSEDYDMLLVFGIQIKPGIHVTKTDISRLTRALNRRSFNRPVVLLIHYGNLLSFSAAERGQYQRPGQQGEKIGRISILRDITLNESLHAGHERILFQLRINPLKVTSFRELYDQWLEVFNISILNKEFYNELFTWYLWAVRIVSFPNRIDDNTDSTLYNSENVIRLLTRLIFCWFIKEKGLIPEVLFNKNELFDYLKKFKPEADNNSDYYTAILQNLFFATLNTEMPKDGGKREFLDETKKNKSTGYTDEYMDHLLFRSKNLFIDPAESLKLFENIPFLNGGLFECLDRRDPETNEEIRIDGFSSKTNKQPKVPNILFFGRNDNLDLSNEFEDGNKHKHSTSRGIINILNSYKFTIEENTPIEQEIALDPELLGKIFENLLASYNPETKTTARKQTGSFYTPREIVNFMVDESLIAYLKTMLTEKPKVFQELGNQQTNFLGKLAKKGQLSMQIDIAAGKWLDKENELEIKLRKLFAYESESNPFHSDVETTEAIIAHISECHILDPACGSGAFPMGVLHKMVLALGKLDPCNFTWKQAQLEKAKRDKQRASKFEDENLREIAINSASAKIGYIEESFGKTEHELDYTRKLFLIENCIYGVDKQQIAVQISKLRFFISLMVDQRVDDTKRNRNILSLPNLETKFVAANTLIAIEKPVKEGQMYSLIGMDTDVKKLEDELHEIRQRIFFTKRYSDKKQLKKTELEKRKNLRITLMKSGFPESAAGQVASWDPFDPLHSAPFFDPEIMFAMPPDKQGGFFDIVIGNPPYIDSKKLKNISDSLKKFRIYNGSADIYVYFYEKGITLLKKLGIISFITSNKWIRSEYGRNLRRLILHNANPLFLVDFGTNRVFDATVDSNILLVQNSENNDSLRFCQISEKFDKVNLIEHISNNSLIAPRFTEEAWLFTKGEKNVIREKIEKRGIPLNDFGVKILRGILTGLNDAFIIDNDTKLYLIKQDKKNSEIIKPLVKGNNIKKYKYDYSNLWLINTHNGVIAKNIVPINVKEDYPTIYKWLEKFLPEIEKRQDKGLHWSNLRNCAYLDEFEKEKILWQGVAKRIEFSYDNIGVYSDVTTFLLTGNNLKYLLAILNSKLFEFSLVNIYLEGDTFKSKNQIIQHFPIPKIKEKDQYLFKYLVDQILTSKTENSQFQTSLIERRLDLMVYKLYTLSYEECQIVDLEIESLISRKDYENASIEELSNWNLK